MIQGVPKAPQRPRNWLTDRNARIGLREHLAYDVAPHIGQAEIAALVPVRQLRVIQPQTVQDRRLQVVHADRVFDDFEPEVVRAADNMAGADAAAAQPHAEGQPVMVPPAAGVLAGRPVFHHRGAPELASPHDQRRIQQAPLLEVGYERGRGPVGCKALLLEAGL